MANATTSIAGDIQLSGDLAGTATSPQLVTTSVTPGSYSIPTITVNTKGLITAATTTTLPLATTSVAGLVRVGSNIAVSGGLISIPPATNNTLGVVRSANQANLSIVGGLINVGPNIALLNQSNVYTGAQLVTTSALTGSGSIAVDGSLSNVYTTTLTSNATLSNPTNLGSGRYTFVIKQDVTGSRTLAFGSSYVFVSGSDTTISTAGNSTTVMRCVSDGTTLYCSLAKNFA